VKISEIFYSLQGEGQLAGIPSVFIRVAGCPLRCRWCDTKYAWDESAGDDYTTEEIIRTISQWRCRHIVITGGEPIISPDVVEIVKSIKAVGKHITIETAGIEFVAGLECNLMSISPKMSNSVPRQRSLSAQHEKRRFNLSALQKLIDNYEYQMKFVVDSARDLDEIDKCLEKLTSVSHGKVFLMAQAVTRDEYISKSRMLAEICKRTGFAFSPRLQILLWNNQRGN